MKKLDRLENDYLPQVSLAQKEVGGLRKRPGPEVIKLFPCSTQLSMKFQLLIKTKYSKTCLKRPLKNRQNTDLNDKW